MIETIISPNHDEKKIDLALHGFYLAIETGLGRKLEELDLPVFFIKSGGTEGIFKEKFFDVKGPVYLLTIPCFNSLPAAMEILSYLKLKKVDAEIIHGETEDVIEKLLTLRNIYERKS